MNKYIGTDNLEVMAEALNYNAFILSLIRRQLKPGMKVLDIGTGIGTFAGPLRDEGYDMVCFEPDPAHAERLGLNGFRVKRSLTDIETSCFDFIYALNVLEHIEDDRGALMQWQRLLKPGGRMLIYVPAFHLLFSSMDRKVGHYRRYRHEDLVDLINRAGGSPVKIRYADSLGFLVSLLYKYKNDGSGDLNRTVLRIYDNFIFPLSRTLDSLVSGLFGKNVYAIAHRKDG
jgi:SAM-dependent methyltransferase